MALTFANREEGVGVDGERYVEADVTFDSSYPTGGEQFTALTELGIREVREIHAIVGVASTPDGARRSSVGHVVPGTANNGRGIRVDFTDPKAPKLLLNTAASTEAANASNQASYKFRLRFVGV